METQLRNSIHFSFRRICIQETQLEKNHRMLANFASNEEIPQSKTIKYKHDQAKTITDITDIGMASSFRQYLGSFTRSLW